MAKSELSAPEKPSLVGAETVKNSSLEKKSDGNLNRLDHTTRVVGGVRQRKFNSCLIAIRFGCNCTMGNRNCVKNEFKIFDFSFYRI